MLLSDSLTKWLVDNGQCSDGLTDSELVKVAQTALDNGALTPAKFAQLQEAKSPSATDVFGGARVKLPSERYSRTKSVGKHVRTGLPVKDERGREAQTVSELENAKAGVLFKRAAARAGLPVTLNEHELELESEIFEKDTFVGNLDGQWQTGIPGSRVKSLLSDNVSGGQYLSPQWLDDAVIQYPLLHSELLPRVDLVNVPRGSSIETAGVGNPSVVWGVAEGTAATPFTTTSLVSQVTADILPVSCYVEIGRDFMADAAVDVGRILVENVGQKLLAELDRVIAVGVGSTTEPQGIFAASGLTDIGTPAGGNGAAPQVADYESLCFGTGKQYRNPAMRCAFIGNDTSYKRARGIPVGGSDARRVFGMDHQSYMLLDYPFVICNDVPNTKCAFGALTKYRLWRRQSSEIRFETGGKTLALSNQALLCVRGRFGGKVVDANAFAFSDNWQA